MQIEGIQEILEKPQKLRSYVCFAGRRWGALRKASADRLLDPDHVSQIYPGVGVLDWLVGSVLPEKWSVFLEKSFERGASRPSIEPDGYFVLGGFIFRWEVPKVKLAGLVFM